MDDIVKALTIKITADDLTGGVWSSLGSAAKELGNSFATTSWVMEKAGGVFDFISDKAQTAINVLSRGGEYAEASANFERLADSYGINAQRMVDGIRDATEGTMGLEEATKAASRAVNLGLGSDQTKQIFEFAKKYTDTIGGDTVEIVNKLENAFKTGKFDKLKTLGLSIGEGEAWVSVGAKLQAKIDAMTGGAFNFKDAWTAVGNAVDDAAIKIDKSLNNLAGAAGFKDFVDGFRSAMREIEDDAPMIAVGIFTPIRDMASEVYDWLTGPDSMATAMVDFFDLGISRTNDMHTNVEAVVKMVGNSFYDISKLLIGLYDTAVAPWVIAQNAIKSTIDTIKNGGMTDTGGFGLSGPGLFDGTLTDVSKLEAKRAAFNKSIDITAQAHREAGAAARGEAQDESDGMLTTAKSDKTAKAERKAAEKAFRAEEKRLRDEAIAERKKEDKDRETAYKREQDIIKQTTANYEKLTKSMGESVKAIGDVMNETQKGINKTEEITATFISDKFDPYFSFSSGEKLRQLKQLLSEQRAEKDKERALLEKQVKAQTDLGQALRDSMTKPKKVEFSVPPNANTTELLMRELAEFLSRMSRNEGTEVQA